MFKKFWLKPVKGLSDLKMWMYILQDEQNNPSTFQLWETFLDFSSYKYKEARTAVAVLERGHLECHKRKQPRWYDGKKMVGALLS